MYSAFWGIKVARLKTIKTHRVPVPSLSEEALRPPIQSLLATVGNCIKIGLPGKLILGKREGLWEVIFS